MIARPEETEAQSGAGLGRAHSDLQRVAGAEPEHEVGIIPGNVVQVTCGGRRAPLARAPNVIEDMQQTAVRGLPMLLLRLHDCKKAIVIRPRGARDGGAAEG